MAGSAEACSCAHNPADEPPERVKFEGTALRGRPADEPEQVWTFAVEHVIQGVAQAEEQVGLPAKGSTCQSGPSPVEGKRYLVDATVSRNESGDRQLYVNLCAGTLSKLIDAPDRTSPSAPIIEETATEPLQENDAVPWLAGGGVVFTAALALVVIVRQARRGHLPAPRSSMTSATGSGVSTAER